VFHERSLQHLSDFALESFLPLDERAKRLFLRPVCCEYACAKSFLTKEQQLAFGN
jgi:hypothetical protein